MSATSKSEKNKFLVSLPGVYSEIIISSKLNFQTVPFYNWLRLLVYSLYTLLNLHFLAFLFHFYVFYILFLLFFVLCAYSH